MSIIHTEKFILPPCNKAEILRYCGAKESDKSLDGLIDGCISEADGKLSPRVCWKEYDIKHIPEGVDLGFAKVSSRLLERHLFGCHRIALFAATVGIEIDRLIMKYSHISPSRAVVFQAIGAERIEALCDMLENKIKLDCEMSGKSTVHRVSPGYGDIPLTLQRDIIAALDCPKTVGISLNDSLLMSPTKSVTAIIGVKNEH